MSSGIGGLKPNTLVLTLPEERKDEETMGSAEKAFYRKLEVTSNSVYEQGAADGCRITCAYQRELWSTTEIASGSIDESSEIAGQHTPPALRNNVSTGAPLGSCCEAMYTR